MAESEEKYTGGQDGPVPNADLSHDEAKHLQSPSRHALTEESALARARKNPQDALPIYLTFSNDDKDNPRNWPKVEEMVYHVLCFHAQRPYVCTPS